MQNSGNIEDLEEAELDLTSTYESQISITTPYGLFMVLKKLFAKKWNNSAKESINIRAGFMFKEEAENLKEKINKRGDEKRK